MSLIDRIARELAVKVLTEAAKQVNYRELAEVLDEEVPLLGPATYDKILGRAEDYVKVADFHVSFAEWRLKPEGGVLTDEEAKNKRASGWAALEDLDVR